MSPCIGFQAVNIPVGTGLTRLLDLPLAGLGPLLSFELANVGAVAVNNFVIVRRLHDGGSFMNYLGGDDFATATSKCVCSNPGPQQLPPGQSAWVDVDCGSAIAVQLWASVAGASGMLSVFGSASIRP